MKRLLPLALATVIAASQPACYGSFSAFHALHRWNGHATGSKVGNSIIHGALWLVGVYPVVTLIGDLFIFNTIEFVTDKRVFD